MECPKCNTINPDDTDHCSKCGNALKKEGPTTKGPPRPTDVEYAKKYWERLDRLFYRTMKHAETAFKVNLGINLVVVGVGISLLAYSIYYSWINNLDVYSVAFGSLGVVTFISTFFFAPQRKIQRTVGDLTQIQIIYRSYCTFEEALSDWEWVHKDKGMTLNDLGEMNTQLAKMMQAATNSIEQVVGED
jgi:ABC-type multidrug transport system fused ATPase/permease subunit